MKGCKCTWAKYRPLKGTLQAVYHVDFTNHKKGKNFKEILYLIIPGETRLGHNMPEIRYRNQEESHSQTNLQVSYVYLKSLKMLIQVFPNDMKIPHLQTLFDPIKVLPYLQKHNDLNEMKIKKISLLKYKPERRCVIKYDLGSVSKNSKIKECSVIGKTFHNERGEENFRIMQFLKSSGLPVPNSFYIPEIKLLLTKYLKGKELQFFVDDPSFPTYVKNAAIEVARLHKVPIELNFLKNVYLDEEKKHFLGKLEKFQLEFPLMKDNIINFSLNFNRKFLNRGGRELTFVHGELDPTQLMVSKSKIWFVDFDVFKISHPAIDVGRFLAYLNRLSIKRYSEINRLNKMEKLFLQNYLSTFSGSNELQRQILICQAMECVKVAIIQFRRQRPGWEFRLSSFWNQAEKLLSEV